MASLPQKVRRAATRLLAMRQDEHFRSLGFRVQPYQIERKIGFCNTDVGPSVAAASRDGRIVDGRQAIELERRRFYFLAPNREIKFGVLKRDRGKHRGPCDAALFRNPQDEFRLGHLTHRWILPTDAGDRGCDLLL